MYLAHIALAVACLVVQGKGQGNIGSDENPADNDNEESKTLIDNHTFVALIDIVFTDNTKKTCTGTIIHDNVVITAAHCFKVDDTDKQPELTASFVIIGTKIMFDSGYEQYLPIERVVTHPKYKGWTADLSLVFTFAGMTSDKPGSIIPLAGEKTSTHVDSNVTILSWGRASSSEKASSWEKSKPIKQYDSGDASCSSTEQENIEKEKSDEQDFQKRKATKYLSKKNWNSYRSYQTKKTALREVRSKNVMNEKTIRKNIENLKDSISEGETTKVISRYLAESERENPEKDSLTTTFTPYMNGDMLDTTKKDFYYRNRNKKKHRNKTAITDTTTNLTTLTESDLELLYKNGDTITARTATSQIFSFKSYFKNWRRQMGTQQNRLAVETFGFVNLQSCKLLVEKALPNEYDITKNNDVLCYTNADGYITDNDSGAPAIRHGQLVAVTVGGAECDGDHVAVGMKMSCYCTWIADNLPSGGKDLNCCKNCCDIKHKEEVKNDKRYKFKNKYLL